jgi:hypothetical protein
MRAAEGNTVSSLNPGELEDDALRNGALSGIRRAALSVVFCRGALNSSYASFG